MSLSSMTGFARLDGAFGGGTFVFEARRVNGRAFEMRFKMPTGFEALEQNLRARAAERIKRGNIQVSLQLATTAGASHGFRVNWAAVEELAHVLDRLGVRLGASPASLDGILQLRGILETGEAPESPEVRSEREAQIIAAFDTLLGSLDAARRSEGARLEAILNGQITAIEKLVAAARERLASVAINLREKLKAQIQMALESAPQLSEDRLSQEVALLLVKADVGEELDRLSSHIEAARHCFASTEPQGRRLEFLAQEFQREANTLCSKSADIDLTRIGIDLKSIIDQFREQAQNIE